jgi:hypothetical protein
MKTENMRLSAATILRCEAEADARHEAEKAKGSTAEVFDLSAKSVEMYIRHACYSKGLRSTSDFRARSAKTADLILTINGKRYRADVKTGGTVGTLTGREWTEEDILPDAAYVVFPVMNHIHREAELYSRSAIISKAEFISLLELTSRKGVRGALHAVISKKRAPVLAFQPQPLSLLRAIVWDLIKQGKAYTVQDYLRERGL